MAFSNYPSTLFNKNSPILSFYLNLVLGNLLPEHLEIRAPFSSVHLLVQHSGSPGLLQQFCEVLPAPGPDEGGLAVFTPPGD